MEVNNVDLGLAGTHVLITGAAGHIGRGTVSAFLSAGAHVSALDISQAGLVKLHHDIIDSDKSENVFHAESAFDGVVADITLEESVEIAFDEQIAKFGPIQCCVALAGLDLSYLPHHASIVDVSLEQWKRTFEVNANGTFLTARAWLRQLKNAPPNMNNVSLIIVGSESGSFGERCNPDYAASKSAIQGGLLQSLKADVPRMYTGARVNAIAPGPVDTEQFRQECRADPELYYLDAQGTVALGKAVSVASVARSIVYLASETFSANVHGQLLSIDSGKQGKVMWTREEASRMRRGSSNV